MKLSEGFLQEQAVSQTSCFWTYIHRDLSHLKWTLTSLFQPKKEVFLSLGNAQA